jgi:hypothetical protein
MYTYPHSESHVTSKTGDESFQKIVDKMILEGLEG